MSSHKAASKHSDFTSSSSSRSSAVPAGSSSHDASATTIASLPTSHQPLDADPPLSNEEEDETSQSTLPSTSHRRPHGPSHSSLSAHHPHSSTRPASPPASSPPSSQPDAELDSADDSEDDGSDSYGSEDDYAWIPWFCALKGNEFFCEVDEEFAQDAFNLTGLEQLVPYFDQALDMILDVELADVMNEETQEVIENDAENLFGLIHARYIITSRGLQAMVTQTQQHTVTRTHTERDEWWVEGRSRMVRRLCGQGREGREGGREGGRKEGRDLLGECGGEWRC